MPRSCDCFTSGLHRGYMGMAVVDRQQEYGNECGLRPHFLWCLMKIILSNLFHIVII